MKRFMRILAWVLMMTLWLPAHAATTPTPPPLAIAGAVAEPPTEIRKMLDIAYNEWETLAGKTLSDCNKFTEWRGKGVSFGWCAGYVTWCMIEAGIPMEELESIVAAAKASPDTLYHTSGVYHVMEASVGKVMRGYQAMGRATNIPQPGYLLVYGCSYNKTIHLALIYDVQLLENGKYRITTLEGNMSNRVKMYIRDYDPTVKVNTNSKSSTNLTEIPEDERILPASNHVDYSIPSAKPSSSATGKYKYYVNQILMPWIPGDPALTYSETATVTPAPAATPTPGPIAPPEAAAPTVTPGPDASAANPAPETTPAPEITPAPDAHTGADGISTFPCQGKDGACPYITRDADDPFCRACDRNDNGIEDSKE